MEAFLPGFYRCICRLCRLGSRDRESEHLTFIAYFVKFRETIVRREELC